MIIEVKNLKKEEAKLSGNLIPGGAKKQINLKGLVAIKKLFMDYINKSDIFDMRVVDDNCAYWVQFTKLYGRRFRDLILEVNHNGNNKGGAFKVAKKAKKAKKEEEATKEEAPKEEAPAEEPAKEEAPAEEPAKEEAPAEEPVKEEKKEEPKKSSKKSSSKSSKKAAKTTKKKKK